MFDPEETEVQIALGTYKIWWINISSGSLYDPDWLKDVLEKHLPKHELWTQGNHKAWCTMEHIAALADDFDNRSPRVSISIARVDDGKFKDVRV